MQFDNFAISIDGQRITGRRTGVSASHGLIVALHGGGYDARYWHAADDSDESLLRVGASLGYNVIAVDRPGYQTCATADPRGICLAAQADLFFTFIDRVASDSTEPVCLIGHSMGGILALMMAADPRSARLAAIDVSGVPLRYPEQMQPFLDRSLAAATASVSGSPAEVTADVRRWMFYGADGTFNPVVVSHAERHNPVPANELVDALQAPAVLPPLMSRIRLPVQWTIPDQERSSEGGLSMLDYVRSLMPDCPRLITVLQLASGHNISLHHVARAYHLRAIAFFEESLLIQRWTRENQVK